MQGRAVHSSLFRRTFGRPSPLTFTSVTDANRVCHSEHAIAASAHVWEVHVVLQLLDDAQYELEERKISELEEPLQ